MTAFGTLVPLTVFGYRFVGSFSCLPFDFHKFVPKMSFVMALSKVRLATSMSRHFSSTSQLAAIKHVTVIGSGLMGSGIAQVGLVSLDVVGLFQKFVLYIICIALYRLLLRADIM